MKNLFVLSILALFAFTQFIFAQTPPYSGTIFVESDIISPSDPYTLSNVRYKKRESRNVFDRRLDAFTQINAYIFDITYTDGTTAEAIVNPEFGSIQAAQEQAEIYARYTSQLPYVLKSGVKDLIIHKGKQLWVDHVMAY